MPRRFTKPEPLTPREAGRQLAEQAPPISAEQARAAARIFATVRQDDADAGSRDDAA